jgi:hypothetical protein
MLEEILIKIKKRYPDLKCWIAGLKEESFEDSTLTISVPSQYHIEKFENGYKNLIADTASEVLGRKIYVQLQLSLPNIEVAQPQKTEIETKTESKKFDSNPNFKNKTEVEEYVEYAQKDKEASVILSVAESKPMPNPYSIERVICCTGFSPEYFTTPRDKRESARVKLKVKCQNGDVKEYDLHRGKSVFSAKKGEGQLNTTHAKILLAIIHIWQKQGCRFVDNRFSSMVVVSLRELADALGYKSYSGATSRWLLERLKELNQRHNMLSDGKNAIAFTFIRDIIQQKSENSRDGLKIVIVFNPFISRQLYGRKAFYRSSDCYKLKNPTAIKLLLTYDSIIVKGNRITKMVNDVIRDMQIQDKRKDAVIRDLCTAVKELNGYELNNQYNLKAGMVKIGKDWTMIAERVTKTHSYHN